MLNIESVSLRHIFNINFVIRSFNQIIDFIHIDQCLATFRLYCEMHHIELLATLRCQFRDILSNLEQTSDLCMCVYSTRRSDMYIFLFICDLLKMV